MAKKLAEIKLFIKSRENDFLKYLENSLDQEVIQFIFDLTEKTNAYLFSGVIRNYFLNISAIRDIDIVVESDNQLNELIEKFQYRKNSFGGFKMKVGNTEIDLWSIHKTWALNSHQKIINYELDKYIPSTAFFNFSSIIYSLNERQFIYTKHFLSFLRDKEIDVVYEPNANYQLCVINSFYYSDRYKLKVSTKLKNIIKRIYYREDADYTFVQQKHFGKVLYDNKEIERRITAISI